MTKIKNKCPKQKSFYISLISKRVIHLEKTLISLLQILLNARGEAIFLKNIQSRGKGNAMLIR